MRYLFIQLFHLEIVIISVRGQSSRHNFEGLHLFSSVECKLRVPPGKGYTFGVERVIISYFEDVWRVIHSLREVWIFSTNHSLVA